jgi:glycosyltransferase involved in cell wall biosynthesis
MNILYLCDEYPPGRHGGIGTVVQLLARQMVRQGYKVVVAGFYDWGYGGEDRFEDEGVQVYRFRRGLDSSFFQKQDSLYVRAMYKLLKISGIFQHDVKQSLERYRVFLEGLIQQYNIEVVEMPDYNDYMRHINSYIAFPKLSVPVIVKCHGSMTYIAKGNQLPLAQHIWQMEHDLLQQATAVCAVSRYTADTTAEYLQYNKSVAVMHNGIDITQIPPPAKRKDDNLVIYAGALAPYKGVHQLLKAWNLVHKAIPAARLEMYGKGPVEKLKPLLDSSALATVSFYGHTAKAQLFERIAAATVGVYPSYAETFGLIAVETMACRTATIYTERTAGPEIINDGVEGLLVDPASVEDIAEAIIYMFNSKEERDTMAEYGYKKAVSMFDIRHVAGEHEVYYRQVLRQG